MKKYSWNFNDTDEVWGHRYGDSIEECIFEAKTEMEIDQLDYDVIYIGENIQFVPRVDVERVLEDIEQQASEFHGDGDLWDAYNRKKPNELVELSDEMTEVMNKWMQKYGYKPDLYYIDRVKPYSLEGEKTK